MICINSVTVYPSSATITKGQWYYGAWASISSNCPGCAEVRWYSNNSSIASVNATTGYIYGVGTGTTRIYAEATDGSGKKDYITVTVTAPISVTGISISPASKTMNVGDTDYLCETVYPSNATNQTVTWCSSNDSVATVNTYTGFVRAKKAGIVTITACTLDGGFTASCTVTVFIDTVTIQKDGLFNKVVFNKSGKVWRCINHDMLFNEENMNNQTLIHRTRYNFLENYDEQNPATINPIEKIFVDDELKLLYAIDPYGVAKYIEMRAPNGDLADTLEFKDGKFVLLFKRKPKYFARTIDGVWFETTDNDNPSVVISESELLFGMHPLNDNATIAAIVTMAIDIASIALGAVLQKYIKPGSTLDKIRRCFFRFATVGEAYVKQNILAGFNDAIIEDFFESADLDWALDVVTLHNSFTELVNMINNQSPEFYNSTFNYCIEKTNYQIYVELKNGARHKIDDINALINY